MTKTAPQARILDDGTLMIFGVIGDEFDGLAASDVVEEIRRLEGDAVTVLLNSPGGLVTEGLSIFQELATHPAHVTVEISGVAASMGSAIAMAGDTIRMGRQARMMVHDPRTFAAGTAEDLRSAAEMLESLGTSLADIYASRTGLSRERVEAMMAEETWMSAEEAEELGFVDEVVDIGRDPEGLAAVDLEWMEAHYNVPAALARDIKESDMSDEANPKAGEETNTDAPADPQPAGQGGSGGQANGAHPDPSKAAAEAAERAIAEDRKRERERAKAVRQVAAKYGLPDAWATERIEAGDSEADAKAAAADKLYEIQANGNGPGWTPPGVGVSADERDKWFEGMAHWLFVKSGNARLVEDHTGQRPDPGQFKGFRLLDIARDSLERSGVSVRGMAPHDIARRALQPRAEQSGLGTRSDFPVLLENVLHKLLQAAYQTADDQWRNVAATGAVSDFREHPRYRIGSLSNLPEKLESGEFQQLHFPDAEKESIEADTKGAIIGLTRQAIVNDDMDGFARMITMLGRASARSIETDVFNLFTLNSGLGPTMNDGNPLFHARADADNIDTNTGSPAVGTLESGRVKMAQIKDPQGNDFLNLRPAVWVGPIGLGADVRTAVNAEFDFNAETSGNSGKFMKPNVVRDLLDTIVDTPRLTGSRWYMLADPAVAPVLEVVFLDGQESPEIEVEEGFDYDGVRWRVRHDYGVGATDFRGAVTNAG